MTLRPYQEKAIERVEAEFSKGTRSTLIVLATGCHARGERVLAADGRSVTVESVRIGDSLLGADGTPRRVLALHHGAKPCYRVEPVKGKPFIVTEDHMLTLVRTAKSSSPAYPSQRGGSLVDVTVKDWLGWSANKKHLHKLVRASALDFKAVEQKPLPIPPYVLGVLLGDGCFKNNSIDFTAMDREVHNEMSAYASANGWTLRAVPAGLAKTYVFQFGTLGCKGSPLHNALKKLGLRYLGSGDKFIPHEYLTASIHDRLELLAGLIDSDGFTNGGSSDYTTKSERLANDIAFLCRSLGMSAYPTKCRKGIKSSGFVGEYYRLSVNGNTDAIPCRVARRKFTPRKQKKSVTRTGFDVMPMGELEYFGFTVDGDNRYLLDDFTITHNCGKTIVFSNLAAREVRRGGRVLILAHRGELLDQAIDKLYKATGIRAGLEKAEQTSDVTLDEMPYTVVVGSVQSMKSERRLARFKPNEFSLIVIDECHHALTGTYRAVIDHFPKARLLGVTATPDRGDLRSLSEVFQTISFEYSIIEAIKDGYLSPIHAQTIPLRIDLRGVAKQAGDYQAAGLGAALAPYLHQICREIKQRCADRKTIVFTPLISISREMLAIFKEEGVSEVREVNGDSADRAETLEWFASAPKGCVLLNSMLLTEGYDEPSVDCIVVLRATKVRSLFCLDEQTEVLTRNGWKRDVNIGEEVLAFDKDTDETRFVPTLAKVRRPLNDDECFYSIMGQSCDIRVTNKHRMLFDNKRRLGWKFKTAEEVAALKDGAYIPMCGHGKFKGVPLTDAEIEFIGWVMSDGSINKLTHGIAISQSSHHVEYCEMIERCIVACGFKFGKHIVKRDTQYNQNGDNIVWTISHGKPRGRDKHLSGWARLEPWISKDLSERLYDMTEAQFDLLLKTVWLGDGKKAWKTSFHIGKGNKTFIERLQAMAIQRGWRASVSVERADGVLRKHDLWYIHAKKQNYVKVGARHGDHAQWQKESGRGESCWCVETELGTIVTRRNGKVAIMGNCQMVGRGTRLSPETGKKNLLLLDFLWLTATHDLCRPACLLSEDPNVCEEITHKTEKKTGADEDIEISPELVDEAESEFTKKCKDTLAKRLEAQSHKKGKLFDALQYAALTGATDLANVPTTLQEDDRPTLEQVDRLEKLGFACPGSKAGAEKLLNAYQQRVDDGLSTHKQIKFLTSRGFQDVKYWTLRDAEKMIRRIAAVGWNRLPAGVDPATYVP